MAQKLLKNEKILLEAAQNGDIEKARKALEFGLPKNKNMIDVRHPETQETALIIAARTNNIGMLYFLLDEGANLSLVDRGGRSALYYCVWHNQKEAVGHLLDAGADVQCQIGSSIWYYPIHNNKPDMINLLVQKGVSLDIMDDFDESVVKYAFYAGHVRVFQALADNGVDFTKTNEAGDTMLHTLGYGMSRGNKDIISFFIRQGIDINQQNVYGKTPLITGATTSSLEHLQALIDCGANINAQDKNGNTALMNAILEDKHEVVELLIQNGADMNVRNSAGKNALMLADYRGLQNWYEPLQRLCTKSALVLIQNGAELVEREKEPYGTATSDMPYQPNIAYTPIGIKNVADRMSPAEISRALKEHKDFLQQIVTAGIVVDICKNLSYNETKEYYNMTHKVLSKDMKKQVEDVVRQKREHINDA